MAMPLGPTAPRSPEQPPELRALQTEPRPDFLLFVRPETVSLFHVKATRVGDIEIPGGPRWLPDPITILDVPGANSVRVLKKGEPESAKWSSTIRDQTERGATLIDPNQDIPVELLADIYPKGGYRRPWDVDWKGTLDKRWTTPWDVPQNTAGGEVRWKYDHGLYGAWIYWLIATGKIPGPSDAHAQDQVAAAEQVLMETKTRQYQPDLRREKVAAADEKARLAQEAKIGIEEGRSQAEVEAAATTAAAERAAQARMERVAEAEREIAARAATAEKEANARIAAAEKAAQARIAEAEKAAQARIAEAEKAANEQLAARAAPEVAEAGTGGEPPAKKAAKPPKDGGR